jgi:hypothetical protein
MEFNQVEINGGHISDETLLLAIDGELTNREAAEVEGHLAACWDCRARRREIDNAIGVYLRVQRRNFESRIPPATGPRALLKARLLHLAETAPVPPRRLPPLWLQIAAVAVIAALATVVAGHWSALHRAAARQSAALPVPARSVPARSVPDVSLTPGATILASRTQVCSGSNPNNRAVPASLQRKVFEEYGIPGAQSVAYEVDYLITPALGGADDIHNLWPQSYSQTVWNARVKDALESRLHDLVCQGQLDLATAQRDISANWIAAYKKYFQTDRPLETAAPQDDERP